MPEVFDTLLLLALPASGKSEVRTYLTARDPEAFHMGPTVQLDDYPYVHLQILCDGALAKLGHETVYHRAESGTELNGPFRDVRELGGLIHLLNEDYADLRAGRADRPARPGERMLERLDRASEAAGARPKFRAMAEDLRAQVAAAIDAEARRLFEEKAAATPGSLEGRTVVIEFARGGPPGDAMPLPAGFGYAGSLPHLSPEILSRAAILYIWVDPAESRRRNRERARPDGQGSILFHGTPESVMEAEYSRCDLRYLAEGSPTPGTVRVEALAGGVFDVPVAIFDNRKDLTTFLRKDPAEWSAAEVAAIQAELADPCAKLWQRYSHRGR